MRAVILFILACLWGFASAEVYTWRDASGKIHYSDAQPPGVEAKKSGCDAQGLCHCNLTSRKPDQTSATPKTTGARR